MRPGGAATGARSGRRNRQVNQAHRPLAQRSPVGGPSNGYTKGRGRAASILHRGIRMSSRRYVSTPQPLRPQPASPPDESTVAARQAAFRARLRGADVPAPAAPRPSAAVSSSPSPVGRTLDKSGYALVRAPRHPHCNSGGYIREHRLVMEQVIGRLLYQTRS